MITKEKLENYRNQGLSRKEIAEAENVTALTVRGWIRKYKLAKKREDGEKCVHCEKILTGNQTKYCSKICACKQGNIKYQNYLSQQERGVKRKLDLILLRGSKCEICEYNRNISALQFHHRNPEEKETNMDIRKLSNSKWEWCLAELEKCQLLCANCHAETHFPHLELKNLLDAKGIEPSLSGLSSQP